MGKGNRARRAAAKSRSRTGLKGGLGDIDLGAVPPVVVGTSPPRVEAVENPPLLLPAKYKKLTPGERRLLASGDKPLLSLVGTAEDLADEVADEIRQRRAVLGQAAMTAMSDRRDATDEGYADDEDHRLAIAGERLLDEVINDRLGLPPGDGEEIDGEIVERDSLASVSMEQTEIEDRTASTEKWNEYLESETKAYHDKLLEGYSPQKLLPAPPAAPAPTPARPSPSRSYAFPATGGSALTRQVEIDYRTDGRFLAGWGVPRSRAAREAQRGLAAWRRREDRRALGKATHMLAKILRVDMSVVSHNTEDYLLGGEAKRFSKLMDSYNRSKSAGTPHSLMAMLWNFVMSRQRMKGRVPFLDCNYLGDQTAQVFFLKRLVFEGYLTEETAQEVRAKLLAA